MTVPAPLLAFATEILRLSVWLMLLAAIFVPLERWFALHPQKLLRPAIAADLGYYFLNSLLFGFLLGVPLAFVALLAHRVIPVPIQDAIAQAPLWLRMAVGLLIGETGAYWGHRWSHEIPLLWRFHAIHHQAEQIDWLVNTRTHPVDMVFTRLCTLTPLFILGLGGPAGASDSIIPALVLVVGVTWGFFVHANIRGRFGPLEHLLASPAFHHWHHTREGPLDRNYAALLPWLDRLFGTHHLPPRQWPAGYGIARESGPP